MTLQYQFKKNGVAIPGATASSLSLSVVDEDDNGRYTLEVTETVSGRKRVFGPLTIGVSGVSSWWERDITPDITEQPATLWLDPHRVTLADNNFREIRWVANGYGYVARIEAAGMVGVFEGDAYGAWYSGIDADRISGISGKTTLVGYTYYSLTNSTWTLEWDVTPSFTATKVAVYAYQGGTNGVIEVYRVRGGTPALAGEIDLSSGGTGGVAQFQHVLNSAVDFISGDTVRIKRKDGNSVTCRIHSVAVCSASLPVSGQGVLVDGQQVITGTASSLEWAYNGAPDGESAVFFGNVAHQVPMTEDNRIFGFTVDGTPQSTQGIYSGVVRCTRQADIDFDGADRHFASYEMEYRAVKSGLRIYHKVTFNEPSFVTTRHIAMLPTPYALTTEANAGGVVRTIGPGGSPGDLGQAGHLQGQLATTSKGNLIAGVVSQSVKSDVVSVNNATGNKLYLTLAGTGNYDTNEFIEEAWVLVLGLPR